MSAYLDKKVNTTKPKKKWKKYTHTTNRYVSRVTKQDKYYNQISLS